ncbi:NADPH--cytochrome P450 reductase [Lingula anatina]|uniref:NADPH--cytochrome P450 reductase n=1 Tax=Lingula anatina TaxID=7574 RepID=A0A1S3HEC8_LINAN|nr:NADPH--cytochrome P450 reductase [Lingula anatina]XP_013384427.1 NADPH--cytochrome P450 reductase [Lingula anatina]|eukprot:XP_013384420.1 NADPH--cytochrome P450 reductase [Lingula anatina]
MVLVTITLEASTEAVTEASEPLLGMLDIAILGVIAMGLVYWFFLRGKKEEPPTIKKLTVLPSTVRADDTNFVNKMKHGGKNVIVFYGSQTGTAEEFAGRLSKDASRYGMKGITADPEECDMEELPQLAEIENSLAIFCMATYGEGDPTDNAQEFYDWLQNGDADLSGVRYAVFSLGNKTYEHYNAMGKYVDKRLEELGATRIYEVGLGDDDANIEEDFVTWREKFWPAVCEHFGVEATGEDVNMRQFAVEIHEDTPKEKIFSGEPARLGSFRNQKPPYDSKNPFLAPVIVNRELHKGGDRSCMHIELDITGSRIRYEAGDHVAVFPTNDPQLVEALGTRLGVDLDQVMSLNNVDEEASKKHPFPCPTTYRTALLHYLDIVSPPRTHILKELSDYAEDPKDKEFLQKLACASEEGKNLYIEWVAKDHRDILTVLTDLPSLKPPIDYLCELLPRLQARYYSISSSPKLYPSSIHITAVLVDYQTRTGRPVKGVATNWLALKHPTNGIKPTVPIFVRKSQFRLPFKASTPVIMIGPGTGLAPFRGFIQERHFLKKEGKEIGPTVLFFGCRKKAEDYLYEEELQSYCMDGSLSHLHVAFSREQQHKIYVQHLIKQQKEEIWELLEAGGHIYVCGDARNMAKDVHSCMTDIVEELGKIPRSQAEDYVKKLHTKGRYSADVWS